jgi:ABC-type multidrug transport system fused ATPase/permease subunit
VARPALRDVSLTIDRGQTIALVGENGSGKTTLAKLVAGLYSPTSGRVCWDGRDLRDLPRTSVADRVMMVLQEPIRWPHTARVNVRAGRHDRVDPTGAALAGAAAQAGADEVVDRLPHGWHTLLSKQFRGGLDLSGGQWQRLAVARGLYRDAPLLIWDEPTGPLDARAEFAVYESLRTLAEDRTVVLITHRLASVRRADRIYLLHEGRLAEQGTHAELMELGGRYAELYELQARMYAAPADA